MRVRLRFESLQGTTAREWTSRFVFGGTVTVLAGLVSRKWGPVLGGLFLAFPGIFPPSASMVEKHKIQREAQQGKRGVRMGRGEASVEATGASAGALGLAAFAAVVWAGLPAHRPAAALCAALAAWMVVSWVAWFIRERM